MTVGAASLALATALIGLGVFPSANAVYGGDVYTGPSGSLPFVQIIDHGLQCGATLIKPGWVLTADHCVNELPYNPELRVGSATVGQGIQTGVEQVYGNSSLDVAVLKLTTPIQGITPVRLANQYPAVGSQGTIFGWGRTTRDNSGAVSQQLKQATEVVRQAEGNEILTGRVTGWSRYGDSGGPFMMTADGDPVPQGGGLQYGIISSADNEGTSNEVGVLVPVAAALPFIRQATGDDSLGG